VLIADRMKEYNQVRPQSSLGCRTPAPEAQLKIVSGLASKNKVIEVMSLQGDGQ
jgi:hypothetical protein